VHAKVIPLIRRPTTAAFLPAIDDVPVGTCDRCGVTFVAKEDHYVAVREVLRVHEIVCPGGDRDGEWAAPFADVDSGRRDSLP
jgi:hypothetical protein